MRKPTWTIAFLVVAFVALAGAQNPCDPVEPGDPTHAGGDYDGEWWITGDDRCEIGASFGDLGDGFFTGSVVATLACFDLPGWPQEFPGDDDFVTFHSFGEIDGGSVRIEGTYTDAPGNPPIMVLGIIGGALDEDGDGSMDVVDANWTVGLAGPYEATGGVTLERVN